MTTISEKKVCERGSGLLAKHCECSCCSDLREELRDLYLAKYQAYLSDRPEDEKERRMLAIEGQIERYKEWL